MKPAHILIAIAAVALALPACSKGAKKTLGLERVKPDEFAVYKRAPLSLPPDYNLRPPEPGAPRPQEAASAERARELITSENIQTIQSTSTLSEIAILRQAGVTQADPEIRAVLREEYGTVPEVGQTTKNVVDKIFGKETTLEGKTIDPLEEAKDLNEQGLNAPIPVTEPIVE